MKIRFIVSSILTLSLIYLLNSSWVIGGKRIPPLGKFLDPFHGFWQNIEPKNFKNLEDANLDGLKEKVTIAYDSLLIPHIFASNDEDLYQAQGYVTAAHRLWQMEFQTQAAAGRLTEILGPGPENKILDYDRGQRRLGLGFGAQNALESFKSDPLALMAAQSYAKGINQYIATLSYKDLPFEYKLLDYEPEEWTPIKSALLLKSMAQTLNMGDKDMEMTNALKLFGKEILDLLYPDREPDTDPIVDNTDGWHFNPIKINDSIPMALPDELIKIKKLPGGDPTTGSNNWAVSGSKTKTGSPILCGDPHLNLSLPSIWYAIQLHTPEVNTMGVSLPGAPCVIIGFNDSIAWSETNAQRDLVDWFKIAFKDNKREKYLVDDQWVDSKKVVEEFKIRGQEIFYDTVVYTQYGPITYDQSYRSENELKNYAFRWISHDASDELTCLYKLNRSKNHDDYMEALNYWAAPAQNFVFASVSGDIAMRVQGKYPVRRKDEGKFVLDGSRGSNTWQAYIPNEQNIAYKNPPRGFVSSANQYPVDVTYPYYINGKSFEAYRNRRINQVLEASNEITPEDMVKLQGDNYNLKAAESLPLFLSYLDSTNLSAQEMRAFTILKSWNYFNNTDSEGASYYEAWWDQLMPMIWDEMINSNVELSMPTTFNTIKLIKENPDLAFFDIQSTKEKETAREVLQKSFTASVKDIADWKETHANKSVPWADFKDSYIGHLLRLEPMSIHIKHGGNHDIVNAHSRTHGPSWRMVVSLEKTGIKSWGVYPGGQSGNPGSYHYASMLDRWTEDKLYKMLFIHSPEEAGDKLLYSISLNPSK